MDFKLLLILLINLNLQIIRRNRFESSSNDIPVFHNITVFKHINNIRPGNSHWFSSPVLKAELISYSHFEGIVSRISVSFLFLRQSTFTPNITINTVSVFF